MKVSNEMVERAKRARVRTLAMSWEKAERIVLEAALADVPEPEDESGDCKRVWPFQAILAEAHLWRMRNEGVERPDLEDLEEILLRDTTNSPSPGKRIAELEAKLAEALAHAKTLPDDVKAHRDEFVRILAGEKP